MKFLRLTLCFLIEVGLISIFAYDVLHFDIAPVAINLTAAILEVGGMIWIGMLIKRILNQAKEK